MSQGNVRRMSSKETKGTTYTHVGRGTYKRIGDGIDEFTRDSEIAYLDFSSRVAKNVGRFNIYKTKQISNKK
jgi:hypothetical protein